MDKISPPSPERQAEMRDAIDTLTALWRYHSEKPLIAFLQDVVFDKHFYDELRLSDGALVNYLKWLSKRNKITFDIDEKNRI